MGALALGFLELQLFHAQNDHHAQLEALVVSDLVPLAAGGHGHRPDRDDFARAIWRRCCKPPPTGWSGWRRPRNTWPIAAKGITRVAEQVASLGERIESLRATLQNIENDRTADLRHELRAIARLLAQASGAVQGSTTMRRRRDSVGEFNIWPAFTDALGGLVMVLVFLITVFVITEVLIGREIMGKDTAIGQLQRIISHLEGLAGDAEKEAARLRGRAQGPRKHRRRAG